VHANDVVAERASRGLDLAPPNSELEFELLALREEAAELAGERAAQARDIARLWANARARDDGVGTCKALERAVLLHRRLEDRSGDAFTCDLGGPYDVAVLPNLLHDFDRAACETLLRKVHGALRAGGR
jgi:hypothetical protein